MKKTILLVVAILLCSMKMMAEGLTATLQQGETMTAFYGVNAFVDAYNAAEDGAVITLSEGQFNDVSSIEKSITVIGNMAFDVEGYEKTFLSGTTVNADNVTLEGIYFTDNVALGNINNCHIKRCRINLIRYLNDYVLNTNTLIDQCVIGMDFAISLSKNYCIKNSTILYFGSLNFKTEIAYITNCFIYNFRKMGASFYHTQPYAIYKNNIIVIDNTSYASDFIYLYSPLEFYSNYFYLITSSDKYYEQNVLQPYFDSSCVNKNNQFSGITSKYDSNIFDGKYKIDSFGMLGDDGTPVGITGSSGFSPYPNIPRITSKQIDSKTDSEGKLNVKITESTEGTLVKEEKPEEGTGEETTGE